MNTRPDPKHQEIDHGAKYWGYREALALIEQYCRPVGIESVPIEAGVGRITSEDLTAIVNTPSMDVSLKDGFAVRSEDVAKACSEHPVRLRVIGSVFAGAQFEGEVSSGAAVKICSGSPIPAGADAVVSGEFCEESHSEVFVRADAQAGRNLLRAGEDIRAGTVVAREATSISPGRLGLIAEAGIDRIEVFRRPHVAVMAVGDEVVAPGKPLQPGQVYAGNMTTICGWLDAFGISFETATAPDDRQAIRRRLLQFPPDVNAILTSGGAWDSERDLIVGVFDDLGWNRLFHHVRMGPGKGAAFGAWEKKTVFCLPGGPASNRMAFLQLALPGILRMAGNNEMPFQTILAGLTTDVEGRHKAWTEFKEADLTCDSLGNYLVAPSRNRSRLRAIADTTFLICVPEGVESLRRGEIVPVQILVPSFGMLTLPRPETSTGPAGPGVTGPGVRSCITTFFHA